MFNALHKKALLATIAAASLSLSLEAAHNAAPAANAAPTVTQTPAANKDKKWHSFYTGQTHKFRALTSSALLVIIIAALAKRHVLNTDTDKNLIAFFSTDANGLSFWDRLSANANGERVKFLEILLLAGLIGGTSYEAITQAHEWRKAANASAK